MLKRVGFLFIPLVLFIFSCNSDSNIKARRLQLLEKREVVSRNAFNPKSDGFRCDSLKIQAVAGGGRISQFILSLGTNVSDTIFLPTKEIPSGAEKDLIISDYNFDGFCEFIVPDKKSALRGGLNYYYFLFDTLSEKFIEIRSLPKFISNFKLDIKNQRVKIYCPNDDCFAYYKYENNTFKLVQGEFKSNP